MSDSPVNETTPSPEGEETQNRRLFLQGMGKWSGAAIFAAVAGASLVIAPQAGAWINRRVGGGGWINGGGGGGWINRRVGGGSWINRF
jgi:hypothetical protein